jgi:hypothetical protein
VALECLSSPAYGNWQVLGPDSVLMFRCNEDRANWYLERGLAVKCGDRAIRLQFIPNGPGSAGDLFYLEERLNICVVCGTDQTLTKHHIVPYGYRRFWPEELKSHNWFDVVLLCKGDHEKYERHAKQLKRQIADEYQVPPNGVPAPYEARWVRMRKAATAIYRHGNDIPEPKKSALLELIKPLFEPGEDITNVDLKTIQGRANTCITPPVPPGKLLMDRVEDYDAFARRWREHFIEHAMPRFMSAHWSPERGAHGRLAEA